MDRYCLCVLQLHKKINCELKNLRMCLIVNEKLYAFLMKNYMHGSINIMCHLFILLPYLFIFYLILLYFIVLFFS